MERTRDFLPTLQCREIDHYDSGGLMICAGITLDGRTYFYVFAGGTVIAVRCKSRFRGAMHVKSIESSNVLPWWGVVVKRGRCQLRCRPHDLAMVQNYVDHRQKPSCS
ncbi:hypothetical protein TNCV_4493961 [Trichonephila clavipes]|nr:hypothetical protein TNCV_4493961 [Trichonephila clavipes]